MREEYRKYTEAADTDEKAVTRLMEIIDILRKECPWDKVQTHDLTAKDLSVRDGPASD